MPEATFDSIPSPDNGLFGWMKDTNRFRVNTNTPGSPTYENLAYASDLDLITLQVAYDNSPGGNINLDLGSPFGLTSTVAGFLTPRMTQSQFDNIPSPNKGLIGYTTDFNRFRVNTNAASPVYEDIAYLSDVNAVDLQTAYDNGVDGNINLSVGNPFELSSLVAGFLMPRMTDLQFNQIANPDAGLLSYASNLQRFITNIGSPATPDYKELAYIDDIPVFQQVGYGEMYFINNATPTPIFAPNIPVNISGTYLAGNLSQFQQSGDALIYNGVSPSECQISVNVSGSMTSDTDTFNFVIYINGVRQNKSQQSTYFGPTSPGDHNVALQMLALLNPLDQVTVAVENTSDADDITIVNFNCIIQELIVGLGQISSVDLQAAYNNGDGSILQNPGKPLSLDVNSDTYYPELTMNNEAILDFGKEAARISFSYGAPSGQLQNASYIRVVNVGGLNPPIEKIDRMQFYCGRDDQPELYMEFDPLANFINGYKTLRMVAGSRIITDDGVLSITSLSGVSRINIPGTFLNGINNGAIRFNHANPTDGVSFGTYPKIGNAAISSTRAIIESATFNYPKNTYQSVWFSGIGNNPYTGELKIRPNEFIIGSKISIEITGLVRYKTVSNQAVGNFKWSFKDQSGSNVIFDLTSNDITTPSISSRVSRPFQLTLNMVRVTNGLTLSQSGFFVTQPNNMLPLIFNFPDNLGTDPTTGFFPFNPAGIDFNIDLEYRWNDGGNNTGFDFMCSGLSINEYVAFDPEFYT
jgi:hypothetical protein